jgi:cellulose synthase/poly-beta-1,6-N-acetylglucosamine synthase-like glycosyltransferase/spore germination protein YaaH/peptidoglycan/xylan/chitin deacetylase (PgdA/CDA1 family)
MSPHSSNQIFQTNSSNRWQRFQWAFRILLILAIIGIVILTITLQTGYTPALPRLKSQQYKKILDSTESFVYKNSLIAQEYGGFRKYINEQKPYPQGGFRPKKLKPIDRRNKIIPHRNNDSSFNSFTKFPAGIRSAFYVTWDPQSFYSLQRNISKLNLVIPEWMFIDAKADTLIIKKDQRAYDIMKAAGVKIMPILSNNENEIFHGDAVQRIITNKEKREKLINDVINELVKNNFVGVNVDFEELNMDNDAPFIAFQKELYEKLHARGLLVTQDVIPFNNDYNYKKLSQYNDYLFIMAYDEFSGDGVPGPICDQKWIEAVIDDAAKKIPPSKMILALGGYGGYDWPKGSEGESVTYQQVLALAREEGATIKFNNDTYNLSFSYKDDNNVSHKVFFTDAATAFNTMRFASEYGLSGVSLWRLGAEDSRIWDFYDKSMTRESLLTFDFKEFTSVESSNDVDYKGEGEVLDILSTPKNGVITPEIDTAEMLISEERYDTLPSTFIVQKYGQADEKKLVLTFDDGPDPKYTPKILDILSREHVPATFFMVGINAENNIPLVKRIYKEGHEIGNHTFTHPNIAEVSTRRAILEMESTRLLIECVTGHSTILFRAPYNADSEPEKMEELIPISLARTRNYLDIGESIDPEDWEEGVEADTIIQRIIKRKAELTAAGQSGNIILLHDAGGKGRQATVDALPVVIDYFKKRGYTFTTVAAILHKTRDDLMPEVPRGSGYYLIQLNYLLAEFGYWGGHILFSVFIVFIILSVARILFLAFFAIKQDKREKKMFFLPMPLPADVPLVSIIVPAYNEELNAVKSLENLLKTDYPNFNIIFIDDGSKDSTFEKVSAAFKNNSKIKVLTKPNGGKASALNYGILQSNADFVVCIDADTKLLPDAVSLLMRHFIDSPGFDRSDVGAVAGNVKVGNEVNLLTKWQSIEYISSQNFDRKAFAALNAIIVVPGAIGAFRKQAIEDAGGFTTDTLAEDCDLTIRILRCEYTIENENKALALTEAPETLNMLIKQRFRWNFGVMQTFWKHRDAFFNPKYKALGWVALPNILIYQYIIPSVIPLADFFMLIGLLTNNAGKIGWYYLVFMLVDIAISLLAFSFEKEKIGKLIWLIPQRFIWRWLMWYVLFKAVRRAIKGELQNWGVLKRTGNVKEVAGV